MNVDKLREHFPGETTCRNFFELMYYIIKSSKGISSVYFSIGGKDNGWTSVLRPFGVILS